MMKGGIEAECSIILLFPWGKQREREREREREVGREERNGILFAVRRERGEGARGSEQEQSCFHTKVATVI